MTKKIIYQIVEYRATDDEPATYTSYKVANRNRKALEVIHAMNDVIFIVEEVVVDVDYIVGEKE